MEDGMTLLKGVFSATKKDGALYFRSSLTYKSKHISLGSYETEALAHQAYLEGTALISDLSINLENYGEFTSVLPYDKCISLLNMRDNGMYFKTPIYMYPKYFYYYLSKDTVLIFDADDLFYYSTHRIMQRGGHLFVADYGMQVNILSRYGIKNYGIAGKDYVYKNQNPFDYRYENIEIINRYYGVTKEEKNGKVFYVAKLHIHGNYIIGRYPDEKDAAIAYNKAVDTLAEQGVQKNFCKNYIEGISSVEYAARYNAVKISNKIRKYKIQGQS